MNKPYNILHIVATGRLNGAERMVQLICRHMLRDTFNPFIVCAGEPLCGIYRSEGHPVETSDVLLPLPGNVIRLRSIINRKRINLIHAHDHRASLTAWLASRFSSGIPLVSHIHNTNPWLTGWHPWKLVETFMRGRYPVSIACSETVRKYYMQFNPRAKKSIIHTVSNGIEITSHKPVNRQILAQELGIPEGRFVYGTVGRLEEQKGIDQLLIAFKKVTAHLENVFLLIVGAGPLEHELKKLTVDLELSRHVAFTGYRDNVYEIFQLMDAFVLASRWEGLPMVLIEAMAQSLPVVATDVGGVGELVRNGETGFLIAPGNIDDLAKMMIEINDKSELRQNLACSAHRLIKREFNVVNQVRKIENIYLSLLG